MQTTSTKVMSPSAARSGSGAKPSVTVSEPSAAALGVGAPPSVSLVHQKGLGSILKVAPPSRCPVVSFLTILRSPNGFSKTTSQDWAGSATLQVAGLGPVG